MGNQKAKLLDLQINSNIDDDVYEKKHRELSAKLASLKQEYKELVSLRKNQENTTKRFEQFRKTLASGEVLEEFDRVVFESVVEKIVVGGYNEEGIEDPLKITFVYKTGIHSEMDGKKFKPQRKNAAGVHRGKHCVPMAVTRVGNCVHMRACSKKENLSEET